MTRLRSLLRLWFTFESRVDRRTYLVHGAGLMALKYAVDVAVVWAGSGTLWTPLDYLQPLLFFERTHLSDAAPFVAPALALWTLPFLWVGVTMTIRRLLDAGRSAWWSLFFFVPPISYAMMLVLAFVPAAGGADGAWEAEGADGAPAARRLPSALLSIGVGAALGLAMMAVAVLLLDSYGLALFMGTPFAVGLVTAYLLCRRYPATRTETTEVVAMTVLFMGGSAFVIGFEGAICLLMVAPLGIVLALMGGLVGRFLAHAGERPMHGAAMIALLLPGSAIAEAGAGEASLREVRSAVVIDASADVVWEEVVAFSPIPEPTSLLFRLGLAYPTHARIEGEGVGAVRYCVFSTGAFVEPITAWEPGRRLAFDVVESPPPLRELSFHSVAPPHLEGYLAPRRGEFRLVPLADGRTRLEGSTWYEQRLRPEGYWAVFSDWIIGKIHGRVLEHIRGSVEGEREE